MTLSDELEDVAAAILRKKDTDYIAFALLPWKPLSLLRAQRMVNLPDAPWRRSLTSEEWLELLEFFDSQYDVELSSDKKLQQNYFSTEFAAIALAATAAKAQMGGPIGLNVRPGTAAVIPQHIRPVTVYASTGAEVEKWPVTAATPGWQPAFFTVNLNQANATTKALSTQNNVVMLVLVIFDLQYTGPMIQEYQMFDNSGAPFGVESLPFDTIGNSIGLWRLRAPFYIGLNSKATVDINFITNAATIPGLWGVQFVSPKYFTGE